MALLGPPEYGAVPNSLRSSLVTHKRIIAEDALGPGGVFWRVLRPPRLLPSCLPPQVGQAEFRHTIGEKTARGRARPDIRPSTGLQQKGVTASHPVARTARGGKRGLTILCKAQWT